MSKELPKTYDHSDVESRLYEKWEKKGYFHEHLIKLKTITRNL